MLSSASRLFVMVILVMTSGYAWCSEEPAQASSPEVSANIENKAAEEYRLKEQISAGKTQSSVSDVGTVLAGLLLVLIIIAGLAYLSKRMNLKLPGTSANLKLVSAMNVGSREKVMLLEVEGEKLLIGVTSHNITLLKNYHAGGANKESDFSERMQSLLERGQVEDA